MSSYYEKMLATGEVKCIDEDIPFDVPQSWGWERWGNIAQTIQYGYNAPALEHGVIKMVRISDIQENCVLWDNVPYCLIDENDIDTYLLKVNDILFARTGGTVGKSFLVEEVPEKAIYAGYLIRTRYSSLLNPRYMKSFMESQLYWEQLKNGTIATAQPNCNGKTLAKMLLPIPPTKEQERIVEKLTQLSSFLDNYGLCQDRLNVLNEEIKEQLKKSILQEAIQGKLVPQLTEEGTAQDLLEQIKTEKQKLIKEGKLKKSALATSAIFRGDDNKYYEQIGGEVTEIELPLDFPSSWSLARLNAVCQLTDGLKTTGKQCLLDAKYLRGKSSGTIVEQGKLVYKGDNIVLVDGENSGEVFIVPQDGYMGSTFKQLWISSSMYEPYVLAFIQFYKETLRNSKKGAAIPHLNKELFYGLIIGIPPLQEQRRIVQKIEQLTQLLK
ncbi:restriction endonuclease subunit S [Bacteroides thetaiotaomicron]|uniref:restriction endonuclease subunit S n=1 Tax=Bacteroides thetaiotaomicron TaxID=818 RepID=UPI00232C9A70|nr:restriction endonuclease subunit S [Bacteroides thetaiotaomicron]MDC2087350.1 restriction endonuclease subunit S [Bacteroides thetaiotaomicron]